MNYPIVIVVVLSLWIAPGAAAKIESPLINRGYTAYAVIGGQPAKIVGFKGEKALVERNGQVTAVNSPQIVVTGGGVFGPGVVTIDKPTFTFWREGDERDGDTYVRFEAKLTADCDINHLFLILLAFPPLGTGAPSTLFQVWGSELKDLKTRRPRTVSIALPRHGNYVYKQWTALIFSGGHPLHTSFGTGAMDLFLSEIERANWEHALSSRLSGTHTGGVFRTFPFTWSERVLTKYSGRTVEATIAIAETGRLAAVTMGPETDPELRAELIAQLQAWLFLPQVENGHPVATRFILPVAIDGPKIVPR